MTYSLLSTRRSLSVGGLKGRLFVPSLLTAELLARRTFTGSSPLDAGPFYIEEALGPLPATVTYWERTDVADPDIIQVVEVPEGTWWQPTVTLDADHGEVWGRYEFQLAERAAGDVRTRLVGFAFNGLILGIYENDGDIELSDEGGGVGSVFGTSAGGVGNAWRVLDFQAVSESSPGAGDGVLRVWMDEGTSPVVEITDHARDIRASDVQFGLGSVGSDTTIRIAQIALFGVDFREEAPVSAGWAATAPFQQYVAPVSEIAVQPSNPSVGDGSTSGKKIADLTRTGGAGDGTWQLTGDLASIAEVDGTALRLTTTVSIGSDDGTTGSVDYTGDSAGGDPATVAVTLSVVDATTDLTLTATAGGGDQTGTLDTSSAFSTLRMLPPNTPLIPAENLPSGVSAADGKRGGTWTRAGAENVVNASDMAIIYVDSLDGGSGVGTIRWAATTNTDNQGNDISGAEVVYVLFSVSGHVDLQGGLDFTKSNRRFCGQTCPVDSNGRAGFIIHGVGGNDQIQGRRVKNSHIILEHLTFSDGRVPYNDDGSVSTREPPYGALDFFEKTNGGGYGHVLAQNCDFLFGLDETVAVSGGGGVCSNTSFVSCMFGPAMFNSGAGKRGYNFFLTTGSRRNEAHGCWIVAGRVRNPWIQNWSDLVYTNNFLYDCTDGIYNRSPNYHNYDKPDWYPLHRFVFCAGNEGVDGPTFNFDNRPWVMLPGNIGSSHNSCHAWTVDNLHDGGDWNLYSTSNDFWYIYTDTMPIDVSRPPVPVEDARDYVINHAGAHRAHPHSVMQRTVDKWTAGETVMWSMQNDGPVETPAQWPGQNIVETNSTPTPPSDPHLPGVRGFTRMEEWLEDQHVAAGGLPYQAFGRRLRFPQGGIVTVTKTGSVTFEPADMASGGSGVIEVTRADGSTVTVTCKVT
jgi:hypothetical protein